MENTRAIRKIEDRHLLLLIRIVEDDGYLRYLQGIYQGTEWEQNIIAGPAKF